MELADRIAFACRYLSDSKVSKILIALIRLYCIVQ